MALQAPWLRYPAEGPMSGQEKNSAETVALSLHCFSLSSSSDGSGRAWEAGGLPAPPGAGCRGGTAQPPRGRSALQRRETGPLAGERVLHATGIGLKRRVRLSLPSC